MKISHTEIYRYSIPMVPFTIATGTMHYAQNIFIKIYTTEGIVGVGECSAFPMIVGETQGTCYELAKDFAAIWKGKNPLELAERLHELHQAIAYNYTAKSCFDMALYDIAAQVAGMPLYAFLGGSVKTIESDLTIGIDTPEKMAEKAVEFVSNGVNIIKVKLGKKPEEDIKRIKHIRKAIGYNTGIRIDANQGWSYEDAEKALVALGDEKIEFCEQPMRTHNDHLLPQLSAISPITIMADESVFNHHDAKRIIRTKAAGYINIKFAKSGGLHEALLINEIAEAAQIPCMMGGMLESRVALTAKVHMAMALNNIKFYDLDTCLLGHLADPVIGGCIFNGMQLSVTDAPGIGATVDEAFLKTLDYCII